jgi:hypothetical protein
VELAEQITSSAQLALDGGFGLPAPVLISLVIVFIIGTYTHLKN